MTKFNAYFKPIFFCFAAGLIFCAWQKSWIIFNFHTVDPSPYQNSKAHKRSANLYFWQNHQWINEKVELLWCTDQSTNLSNLIQAWLAVLNETKADQIKITLQSTLISETGQAAYLSFNQNPFDKEDSTYQKLMLFESLLKTIRSSNLSISSIQLLVQHHPIQDPHLELELPWPVQGFIKQ